MSTFEITLVIARTEQIRKLISKLEDPSPLLKKVGLTLLRESSEAFDKQAFGDIPWMERYPNQSDPMVSYAGAVSDLAGGPNIKPRRFERRPALVDTNTLRRSLSPASGMLGGGKYWVEIGTNIPYAEVAHLGGTTTQAITPSIKANLRIWMKKTETKAAGERKKGVITPKTWKASEAAKKLAFLLDPNVTELETHHVPRPFLGITSHGEADIRTLMTNFFKRN